jgi:hypothetical protein
MSYRKQSDFSTENPKELRRDLQQMDREIDGELRLLADINKLAVRKVIAATTIRFNEILVVDPTNGSVTLTLPLASLHRDGAGKDIVIVRANTGNTITVVCSGADTISNAASLTLAAAVGATRIYFDGAEYWS